MTPEERKEVNQLFDSFSLHASQIVDNYTRDVKLMTDKNNREILDKIDEIMAGIKVSVIKQVEQKFSEIEARLWNLERR